MKMTKIYTLAVLLFLISPWTIDAKKSSSQASTAQPAPTSQGVFATGKSSDSQTKQTLQTNKNTGQYYCTFYNSLRTPVQLSFANDPSVMIPIPAKGSYAKNVNGWSNLEVRATDKSKKLARSGEVGIGDYGYNIRAVIRTTDVKRTNTNTEATYSKTIPKLEIILDAAPLGFNKGKLKGKIANFKSKVEANPEALQDVKNSAQETKAMTQSDIDDVKSQAQSKAQAN